MQREFENGQYIHGFSVGMSKRLIKRRGKGEFTNVRNSEYDVLAECGVNPVVV